MKSQLFLSLWLLMGSKVCLAKNERLFHSVNAHLVDARLDPIVNRGTFRAVIVMLMFSSSLQMSLSC